METVLEKPEIKQPESQEQEISPGMREHFESLIEDIGILGLTNLIKQGKLELLMQEWQNSDFNLEYKKTLLEQRKKWFSMKKEGQLLQEFLKNKIENSDDSGELFRLLYIYISLGHPDTAKFFSNLLDRPVIWNCDDGSNVHTILTFLQARGGPEDVEAIVRYINNILLPGYKRANHLDYDLYPAFTALKSILGDASELLKSLAEKDKTFKGWFEKLKLVAYPSQVPSYLKDKYTFDEFDEAKEAAHLDEMEVQYNDWLENPPSLHKSHSVDDDNGKDQKPESSEIDDEWYPDRKINFYGRFVPKLESGVSVSAENYSSAVTATLKHPSSDAYLNFLNGVVEKKDMEGESFGELSPEKIYRFAVLGSAHALSIAVLEGEVEAALAEIDRVEELVKGQINGLDENKKTKFTEYLARQIDRVRAELENLLSAKPTELPESASSFLVHHAWLNKTREIPDFRKLLAEKIRWAMANYLNDKKVILQDDLPIEDPAFDVLLNIIYQYDSGQEFYKTVEGHDIPVYWEANDKLADFDVNRAVVFGRDGRYFFTALKAHDFGIGEKELKYVIVTRKMIDQGITRKLINDYLRQNGVGLDFTFIDTGFRGTIPELAIRSLADAGGVEISYKEINERIMLISASSTSERRELSRKRSDSGKHANKIKVIEDDRPQPMESPAYLDIDARGKIKPRVEPTSISQQLGSWVVEHVSLRNFAPRLDPDKMIQYIEQDPLKDYQYVEDLSAMGAIATHPVEIWQNDTGKNVILKGGPRHTLQADFLGQRFLDQMFVTVPKTDLISMRVGLRLKMEFLEGWQPGGIHLPDKYKNSEEIKRGLLIDALLGQYDRTPWNFMFNEASESQNVTFIDNGAGVFSRARGGHKGFPDYFDIEQLQEILSNPQFPGQPVNEAYDNFIRVEGGKIKVLDPALLKQFLSSFDGSITDRIIDDFVEQAEYLDGRRSVTDTQATIDELNGRLDSLPKESIDYGTVAE